MEKERINLPIIVEGKYDKSKLKQYFDCTVLVANGFSVFNSKEKQAVLRSLSKDGVIVLTDSDGGGKVIRSFLNGILPKEKIHNVYIPQIEGKERRKVTASKEGFLGVEGMGKDVLFRVLSPFFDNNTTDIVIEKTPITKLDFFRDGLSGGEGAREKRNALAKIYGLPKDMTANALLEAVNILSDFDVYKSNLLKIENK